MVFTTLYPVLIPRDESIRIMTIFLSLCVLVAYIIWFEWWEKSPTKKVEEICAFERFVKKEKKNDISCKSMKKDSFWYLNFIASVVIINICIMNIRRSCSVMFFKKMASYTITKVIFETISSTELIKQILTLKPYCTTLASVYFASCRPKFHMSPLIM